MAHQLATASFTAVLNKFNIPLALTNHLRQHFSNKQILPILEIPLDDYLAEIQLQPVEDIKRRWGGGLCLAEWCTTTYSEEGQLNSNVQSGHLQVPWGDVTFDVFKAVWSDWRGCDKTYFALVFDGDTDERGREFLRAVSCWDDGRKADGSLGICVFQNESFSRDQRLAADIKSATSDDLFLEPGMVERLQRDVVTFFENKSTYKALNIAWKRGLLLFGPPGNGKSHAIKMLVNKCRQPCIYVKNMTSQYYSERCIKDIFIEARKSAPCLLVFEDLDSLLEKKNQSFFLNEIDGFANNDGILILASSNHPERIDDAIIKRPSRFDVKYMFPLPTHDLRLRYAAHWLSKIADPSKRTQPIITFTDQELLAEHIAHETSEFSYAFLQELFLSFLLACTDLASASLPLDANDLLCKQVQKLKEQVQLGTAVKEGDQSEKGSLASEDTS